MSGPSRTQLKDMEKERLARALRDNLKRRKAQARERASESAAKVMDEAATDRASAPEAGGKN